MKLGLGIAINGFGIQFPYKGDDVLWLWPWKRNSGNKYLSFGFDASFPTLKSMDAEWTGYFDALQNLREQELEASLSDTSPAGQEVSND